MTDGHGSRASAPVPWSPVARNPGDGRPIQQGEMSSRDHRSKLGEPRA